MTAPIQIRKKTENKFYTTRFTSRKNQVDKYTPLIYNFMHEQGVYSI